MAIQKLKVFVSLPKNDLSLAEAALRGGADGVKVHLNSHHRASGTNFGTFQEEKPFLEKLSKLNLMKAIMVGQELVPTKEEMQEIKKMGFVAFNAYLKHLQPHLLESGLRPIPALEHGFTAQDIQKINQHKEAWIEASIVDPSLYATPLAEEDLSQYKRIVRDTGKFIIVPTQKKILPSELGKLRDAGVSAILIGIIVMGNTPESIEKATREFVANA